MTVRPARPSDLPCLRAMAEASGYPYPDLSQGYIMAHVEGVWVVADDEDLPIIAVAFERIVQTYLYVPSVSRETFSVIHALRLLHEHVAPELRKFGYREVNAFLPPGIAARFGRRLARTFGWKMNWPSFYKLF